MSANTTTSAWDCCACCKALGRCYAPVERVWGIIASVALFVGAVAAFFFEDLADSITCGSSEWSQNAVWYSLLSILTLIGAILILSYSPWEWYAKNFGFFKTRIGRFLIKGIVGWMLILYGIDNSLPVALALGALLASAGIVHFIAMLPCIIIPKEQGYSRQAGSSLSA
jgi:hypothetical protein